MSIDETTGGPRQRGRRRWLRDVLRVAWLVAVTAAVAYVLVERWRDVGDALGRLSAVAIVGSAAAALVGVGVSCLIWWAVLSGLGSRLPAPAAARVFFYGQLGKYLPGSVWPALAQMELGRDFGVPRRASGAAVVLFMWVHLVSGGAVAALTLPFGPLPWFVALAAVPCVALLWPSLLGRVLAWLLRLARRPPLPALPDAATMRDAVAASLLMWTCYGVHLLVLVRALGGDAGLAVSVGTFAVAWCAGFLFVIAPAGAGAREAVIVALLAPYLPVAEALTVAVVSRLLMSVADVGWGVVGVVAGRRRR